MAKDDGLDYLARRCAEETELYRRGKSYDPSFCFEIFRRAVVDRDQEAWAIITRQYTLLVTSWVYKHRAFPFVNEEAQYFVAGAFERFWKYFTSDKLSKSQSLKAVLDYLQTCVNGEILDDVRKNKHHEQIEQEADDEEPGFPDPGPAPDDSIQEEEFWQLVKKRLKDRKEYTVVYASFSLSLSPREILVEYPGVFRGIDEIYRLKANVLARIGRDPDLREFLGRDD